MLLQTIYSKLRQDSVSHRQLTLETFQPLARPDYAAGDWEAGAQATLELMAAGAEVIYHGVVITQAPWGAGQAGEPNQICWSKSRGGSRLGQLVLHPHRHQAGQKTKNLITKSWPLTTPISFHGLQGGYGPRASCLLLRNGQRYDVDLDPPGD